MRIVGGRHRGRRLTAPAGMDVRPTTDRTRESLFNILAHAGWVGIEGAVVLDAFCGTGALGLEALSRGAERATFLDSAGPSLAAARANIAALGEDGRSLVLRGDATRPPKAPTAHSLAFLDPPYGCDLGPRALAALAAGGWLAPGALAVVEEAASATFTLPDGFTTLDERRYGDTVLRFATLGGA
ncbi:16S rRNA (guanine(966)-N(2))-methyltransferase RsmD [Azospirillum sp. RWY-5-1]|uniref:16S rRNA (Guanine(966)-N(2))-methyltransferase RsmD n=1 Tax=Azospirillum oleiclasticum TaxID=2735135 RepID=A0ABX2TDM2_9PROT|nr:16S rRNA (guanine(966)-N(2))-methyltransferase RsmD [Azospirillum oleiclasticum]NYZ21307.1 16S rRNA (guanine(966)-N(2))-methyltransferase RsmD [Azospirillum oleiclasticum]